MSQLFPHEEPLALLEAMANEIAAIDQLAERTSDWSTSRHMTMLAEGFREILDYFTRVPGLLDGVEPWHPGNSTSRETS